MNDGAYAPDHRSSAKVAIVLVCYVLASFISFFTSKCCFALGIRLPLSEGVGRRIRQKIEVLVPNIQKATNSSGCGTSELRGYGIAFTERRRTHELWRGKPFESYAWVLLGRPRLLR